MTLPPARPIHIEPINMENLQDIDKLLSHSPQDDHLDYEIADALNQLSIQDREKVFHGGIHGVADDEIEETPGFVSEKLNEMREALVRIKEASNCSL
jgi:hypothetical protein